MTGWTPTAYRCGTVSRKSGAKKTTSAGRSCGYATRSDHCATASADLWPEVLYPLLEHAHWQRTFRPPHEALWDYVVGKLLHVPMAGVRLDRMMVIAIPLEVAEQLELDLTTFVDEPQFGAEETSSPEMPVTETQRPTYFGAVIPREELPADDNAPPVRVMIPLAPAEPFLFTQDTLRRLWEEAIDAREQLGAKASGPTDHPLRAVPARGHSDRRRPVDRAARGRPCGRSCRACSSGERRSRSSPLRPWPEAPAHGRWSPSGFTRTRAW